MPTVTSIAPGRPQITYTYQLLRCRLAIRDGDPSRTLIAARTIAVDWLNGKCPWLAHVEAAQRGDSYMSHDEVPGQYLEIIAYPDGSLWTARLEHPDVGLGEHVPPVAGRTWINDLSIQRVGERVHIGIRIACASLPWSTAPVIRVRPAIARRWNEDIGVIDVRPLNGTPWQLGMDSLPEFHAFLVNPERELPVVVLTQPEMSGPLHLTEWVLDPADVARQLCGYAHVALLPRQAAFAWTGTLGKLWSVFGGAVRTYHPGLRPDDQSPYAHPLDLVDDILASSDGNLRSERAFTAMLVRRLKDRPAQQMVLAQHDRTFVPQARTRVAELSREAMSHAIRVAQQSEAIPSAHLRQQIADMQSAHAAEIDALRAQLLEAQQEAQDYEAAWSQADAARVETTRQLTGLKYQLLGLRERLHVHTESRIEYPDTYADMPPWVERHFPGRLVLHPRAVRALKSAVYEDVTLVARALELLANAYWTMRMQGGAEVRDRFDAACAALGLQYSGSIAPSRAGAEGDTYFVKWPMGGNSRLLEWHLRKGSIRDNRLCLAIYFFWDETESCVVVGWLPSHLSNRLT